MLAPAPVGEAPMSAIDVRVCASSASNTVCLFQTTQDVKKSMNPLILHLQYCTMLNNVLCVLMK